MTLPSWIGRWLPDRRPSNRLVADIDNTGVTQNQADDTVRIPWTSVRWVYAYNRDCFTFDSIRLIFVAEDGAQIECSEDEQDFVSLTRVASEHLPGFVADWYTVLASSPAFETNWTVVYKRD